MDASLALVPAKPLWHTRCRRVGASTASVHTANSIRSVLEAIGRFCRPDKSDSLTDFVKHLAGEEDMTLKSVLINSLCHGTYYDETPPPDDLVLACEETLVVVERYAVGQLELIKKAAKA